MGFDWQWYMRGRGPRDPKPPSYITKAEALGIFLPDNTPIPEAINVLLDHIKDCRNGSKHK